MKPFPPPPKRDDARFDEWLTKFVKENSAGNWTPAGTFATAGNAVVTASIAYGRWIRNFGSVFVDFTFTTSAFTHTTASGNFRLTGLPFTAINETNYVAQGDLIWQGITKANYTDVSCQVGAGQNFITFGASGSGQTVAGVTAADMPTGGTLILRGSLTMRI
jgi:hypothetical protein